MKQHIYTSSVIDGDSGEVVRKQWITRKAVNTEHFIKLYLDDLRLLSKLSNADYRLLFNIVIYLEYNTNMFFLTKGRREELAQICDLKMSTINCSVARLVKKNLLIKIDSSQYQMNPNIFFTGEELERAKILEMTIRYEICPDC